MRYSLLRMLHRVDLASNVLRTLARKRDVRVLSRFQEIEGYLNEDEAVALYRLAKSLQPGATIVEIGSWKGKSTYCLARGLKRGTVVAIDPFDASGDQDSVATYESHRGAESLVTQFERNMHVAGVANRVVTKRGRSCAFVGQFRAIDLLFIDGDHSIQACDFDYMNYVPYLVMNGIVAFHDYYEDRPSFGPTWVIHHRILNSTQFTPIGLFGSIWAARRTARGEEPAL